MQQHTIHIQPKSVYLAEPRGFCAGVERAIEIVERSIEVFGAPVYVRHEIVHNKHVVESLKAKGAIFIDDVKDAPDGALLIFSAHGVSKAVQEEGNKRGLRVMDATCPLVTKVHLELLRHYANGDQIILIGHAGHPEVEGTMGQAPAGAVLLVSEPEDVWQLTVTDEHKLAFVTQTTLSVDDTKEVISALQQRFPHIQGPKREDICYATSNRQASVKSLAKQCDVILVIGSTNSSNSNRLREVAEKEGCSAYLVENAAAINLADIKDAAYIGVTAGASAPEVLVQEVINLLSGHNRNIVSTIKTVDEDVHFSIPKALQS